MNKISEEAEKVLALVRNANIEGMDPKSLEFAEEEIPYLKKAPSSLRFSFLRANSRVGIYVYFVEAFDNEIRTRVDLSWSSSMYDTGTMRAAVALATEVTALAERIEAL